ncbi:MAG: hypothetical protein LBD65_03395 [Spirochaetaceae bacterium]|jgi:cbb3-type cytochrome oxidase subunit 3|nr:hypothetical protein [Spirochaetaceae bacterium]
MNVSVLFLPVMVFLLILYFAFSKKSGFLVKKAALITLMILTLSVIISLFLVFSASGGGAGIPIESLPDTPVKPSTANIPALIVFVLLFLIFLGIIIFIFLRERREMIKKEEVPKLSDGVV